LRNITFGISRKLFYVIRIEVEWYVKNKMLIQYQKLPKTIYTSKEFLLHELNPKPVRCSDRLFLIRVLS